MEDILLEELKKDGNAWSSDNVISVVGKGTSLYFFTSRRIYEDFRVADEFSVQCR